LTLRWRLLFGGGFVFFAGIRGAVCFGAFAGIRFLLLVY
jgi:hypothetical protein